MTDIFNAKLVFAAAAFFYLAPCSFSFQNDKELSIVRKDMEDSVIYEMILKTKDEQYPIWRKMVKKRSDGEIDIICRIISYDIKDDKFIAFLAFNRFSFAILLSDNIDSRLPNQAYTVVLANQENTTEHPRHIARLVKEQLDDNRFGVKSYQMVENQGFFSYISYDGIIQVKIPDQVILSPRSDPEKVDLRLYFRDGKFLDDKGNEIPMYYVSNRGFSAIPKGDEIKHEHDHENVDSLHKKSVSEIISPSRSSPSMFSIKTLIISCVSGVVLLAGGVFATRRWRNK